MNAWRQFAAIILGTSCNVFAACSNQTVNSVTSTAIPVISPPNSETHVSGIPQGLLHQASRVPTREAALSTFNGPEYAVSFRYPRRYALEEGNILEHSFFLKRQEELDVEQPGAYLVATVLIPEDAYPNTNFLHGSLQVIAKAPSSSKACGSASSIEPAHRVASISVHDFSLQGRETELMTAGVELRERRYSGLSNGTCYEISLAVATSALADGQNLRQANVAKIMHHLENIVSTFQFHPKVETRSLNAGVN